MGFRIREIDAECKFSSTLTVEALSRAIPHQAITQVLAQEAACEERERKQNQPQVTTEQCRILVPVETPDAGKASSLAEINGIVSSSEQPVHIFGQLRSAGIFAEGGQVRCGLAIEKRQFLKFGARQRMEPSPLAHSQ